MKIISYKEIKEGNGICDWCGEEKKGFCGNKLVREVSMYCTHLKNNFELHWLKKVGWGEVKKLYWATSGHKEYETSKQMEIVTFTPLICRDCIKQLAKN